MPISAIYNLFDAKYEYNGKWSNTFLEKMSKNVDFETFRDSTNFEVGVLSIFLL